MTTFCPISGKHSYATRAEAEHALKEMQRRPGYRRVGAGVYACPDCGLFHTTQSQNLKQHMLKVKTWRSA